jgi:Flp pilus assembly protein TadG
MTPTGRLRQRLRDDDRGVGVVELPVMAVFFFVPLLALAIFVGRLQSGHAAVESAARHAARTISIARDPATASGVAESEAATTVNVGSAMCRTMTFTHTIDGDHVTVTVDCAVDLSEAVFAGVPGTQTVSSTAVEPVDRHRETAP